VPIYQTARYQVNPGAVDKVKAAIAEFVAYVTEHEPGTRIYTAWQQESDPAKFVHLFEVRRRDGAPGARRLRRSTEVRGGLPARTHRRARRLHRLPPDRL
jgi:hypothetical protein